MYQKTRAEYLGLISCLVLFGLLAACQRSATNPTSSPAEGPRAREQQSPSTWSCAGESYQGASLQAFQTPSIPLQEGARAFLLEPGFPLELSVGKDHEISLQSLESQPGKAFSLRQDEFNGFLQASFRDSERGGWMDCRSSQDSSLSESKVAVNHFCQVTWIGAAQLAASFIITFQELSQNQSDTFSLSSDLNLHVEVVNDFVLYALQEKSGIQIERFSLLSHLSFRNQELQVELSEGALQMRCYRGVEE